jgi:hypothetical protein
VLLFGEELTSLAPSDEFFSVSQSYGPIESSSEGFAHQHARRGMVAVYALVNLLQDVLAFIPRYTVHEDSRSGASPVELVPN